MIDANIQNLQVAMNSLEKTAYEQREAGETRERMRELRYSNHLQGSRVVDPSRIAEIARRIMDPRCVRAIQNALMSEDLRRVCHQEETNCDRIINMCDEQMPDLTVKVLRAYKTALLTASENRDDVMRVNKIMETPLEIGPQRFPRDEAQPLLPQHLHNIGVLETFLDGEMAERVVQIQYAIRPLLEMVARGKDIFFLPEDYFAKILDTVEKRQDSLSTVNPDVIAKAIKQYKHAVSIALNPEDMINIQKALEPYTIEELEADRDLPVRGRSYTLPHDPTRPNI